MSRTSNNKFCVPYVYAKLMGCGTDEVAALIQANRAKCLGFHKPRNGEETMRAERKSMAPVKGVYGFEQDDLQRDLGIKALAKVRRPGMSLGRWCAVRVKWGDTKPWIVHVSCHAMLYKDGKLYDNMHPQGIPFETYRYKRRPLQAADQVDVWDERNPYEVAA